MTAMQMLTTTYHKIHENALYIPPYPNLPTFTTPYRIKKSSCDHPLIRTFDMFVHQSP